MENDLQKYILLVTYVAIGNEKIKMGVPFDVRNLTTQKLKLKEYEEKCYWHQVNDVFEKNYDIPPDAVMLRVSRSWKIKKEKIKEDALLRANDVVSKIIGSLSNEVAVSSVPDEGEDIDSKDFRYDPVNNKIVVYNKKEDDESIKGKRKAEESQIVEVKKSKDAGEFGKRKVYFSQNGPDKILKSNSGIAIPTGSTVLDGTIGEIEDVEPELVDLYVTNSDEDFEVENPYIV